MAQVTKAEATVANQLNSPLLRLPAELRNLIYHYALGDRTLILVASQKSLRLFQRDIPAFPLLAVCTQIHTETTFLLYKLNTFDIDHMDTMDTFLATTPVSCIQAIEKLDIGPSTIVSQSAWESCVWLEKFTGLKEVVFTYYASGERLWKLHNKQRWGQLATIMQERIPWVSTSMRDLGDKAHWTKDAFELGVWRFKNRM